MTGVLTFDHGAVSLNGALLPGVLKSMAVRGAVRFDESQMDGMSGKVKNPIGWEDSGITLALKLTSEDDSTCYDKLQQIDAVFKGYDDGANPQIYRIANPHAAARSVEQVIFSGLDSAETEDDDVILASLNFTEHQPIVSRAEKRVASSDKAYPSNSAPAVGSKKAEDPQPDERIMIDVG